MTADLLVLDDLGAEKTSEWVEETMNLIVNTRYNEQRLTIFTTNYQDIPDVDGSELAAVPHRTPDAVAAARDGEFVVLDGADYRELPANGGVDDLIALWKMRKKTLPHCRRPAAAVRRAPSCATARATSSGPAAAPGVSIA